MTPCCVPTPSLTARRSVSAWFTARGLEVDGEELFAQCMATALSRW